MTRKIRYLDLNFTNRPSTGICSCETHAWVTYEVLAGPIVSLLAGCRG